MAGGLYTTSTTWTVLESPYRIDGIVIFSSKTTLTIEPGVSVKFVENTALIINGCIIAIGTPLSPISFYSNNQNIDWDGIQLIGATSSYLTYCDITNSKNSGMIISNSSDIDITNCLIHENLSFEGAGINIEEESINITIQNCTINNNNGIIEDEVMIGGGGIVCSDSDYIIIEINDIYNNVSGTIGGGIYLTECDYTVIRSNSISDNTSISGGGIYVNYGTDNYIQDNVIFNNTTEAANGYGGGVFLKTECNVIGNEIFNNVAGSNGSGIYADSWDGDREFKDNLIHHNNTINGRGGGILMYGSAIIENCEIYSNKASDAGGGIHCCINDPQIINCKIYDNSSYSTDYGDGGISMFQSSPNIYRTVIRDNYAINGGGIFLNDFFVPGSLIQPAILDQCVITGNEAQESCGGLYLFAENYGEYSLIDCRNSIIYDNTAGNSNGNEILIETYTNQIEKSNIIYNCIEPDGIYVDGQLSCVNIANNIFENPLFEDPGNVVLYPITHGYGLTLESNCIDAGDPASSFDLDNTVTDMGCYYFHHDYDIHHFSEGYNWISFPRIRSEVNGNIAVNLVPILRSIDPFNGIININMQADEDYDPELTYDYFATPQWDPDAYPAQSSWLYKIIILPEEERILTVNGERLPDSFSLEDEDPLEYGMYHWLGYWILEPQNIVDAFGGSSPDPDDDFWQCVEKVKAEDWYYDRCSNNRGIRDAQPVSWSTSGKTLEYGKGYMVWFKDQTINNFKWYSSIDLEEPERKAESENFSYVEKPDYEVIDVMGIDPEIIEIGVFADDICLGAVVVQDTCEQILVYSDSANRDPVPFTFEVVTGRGASIPIKDYQVLDLRSGKYEDKLIISGRQEYSVIKLGEEGEPEDNVISTVQLHRNYPNPFNPITTIEFSVTQISEFVTLSIYNIKGQRVKTLYKGDTEAGQHSVVWDGTDANEKSVSSGVYFYKLKACKKELTRKMLLLK